MSVDIRARTADKVTGRVSTAFYEFPYFKIRTNYIHKLLFAWKFRKGVTLW